MSSVASFRRPLAVSSVNRTGTLALMFLLACGTARSSVVAQGSRSAEDTQRAALVTALLSRIDWTEACPRDHPCTAIRVNPQVYRATEVGVERASGNELMLLIETDLPKDPRLPRFTLSGTRFAVGDSSATVVLSVHTDPQRSERMLNVAAVVYSPHQSRGLTIIAHGRRVETKWEIVWIVATPY